MENHIVPRYGTLPLSKHDGCISNAKQLCKVGEGGEAFRI